MRTENSSQAGTAAQHSRSTSSCRCAHALARWKRKDIGEKENTWTETGVQRRGSDEHMTRVAFCVCECVYRGGWRGYRDKHICVHERGFVLLLCQHLARAHTHTRVIDLQYRSFVRLVPRKTSSSRQNSCALRTSVCLLFRSRLIIFTFQFFTSALTLSDMKCAWNARMR